MDQVLQNIRLCLYFIMHKNNKLPWPFSYIEYKTHWFLLLLFHFIIKLWRSQIIMTKLQNISAELYKLLILASFMSSSILHIPAAVL